MSTARQVRTPCLGIPYAEQCCRKSFTTRRAASMNTVSLTAHRCRLLTCRCYTCASKRCRTLPDALRRRTRPVPVAAPARNGAVRPVPPAVLPQAAARAGKRWHRRAVHRLRPPVAGAPGLRDAGTTRSRCSRCTRSRLPKTCCTPASRCRRSKCNGTKCSSSINCCRNTSPHALAVRPQPALTASAWRAAEMQSGLAEVLAGLAVADALPAAPPTGWEETFVLADALAADSEGFVRALLAHNVPLAGRCAAQPEVSISPALRAMLQQTLFERSRDASADLRARSANRASNGAKARTATTCCRWSRFRPERTRSAATRESTPTRRPRTRSQSASSRSHAFR